MRRPYPEVERPFGHFPIERELSKFEKSVSRPTRESRTIAFRVSLVAMTLGGPVLMDRLEVWWKQLVGVLRDTIADDRDYFPVVLTAMAVMMLGWLLARVLSHASSGGRSRAWTGCSRTSCARSSVAALRRS